HQERRQLLERHWTATVHKTAASAKFVLHSVSLCTYGIKPKLQAVSRLTRIFRVGLDKGMVVVSNPPISRVKNDAGGLAQSIRQLQRTKLRREYDRRRIPLKFDPLLRYTTIG